MSSTPQNDDLVQEIVLLRKRPFYFHGYFAPFLFIYATGAFVWKEYIGVEQYEIGIIIAVSIAFLQLLTILFCLWSVDVRCFLMYSKVKLFVDYELRWLTNYTHETHSLCFVCVFSRIFILLSQESDRSVIASSLLSNWPPVDHTKMGKSR